MSGAEHQPGASRTNLRWFQYSLRTLLLFVVVWSMMCSCLAVRMKRARAQKEAAAAIVASGGWVEYDWLPDDPFSDPGRQSGPRWLRRLLGDDFFSTVEGAELSTAQVKTLGGLPHIQGLRLKGDVTAEVVGQIRQLHSLKSLELSVTRITDAETVNLRGLSQLQTLDLSSLLKKAHR